MIFPDVRISELRRERDDRKVAFHRNRRRFISRLKEKARPLTFIREHPQLVATTLFTLLSTPKVAGKAMKLLGIQGKKGLLGKALQFGWILRAIRLGNSFVKNFRSAAV